MTPAPPPPARAGRLGIAVTAVVGLLLALLPGRPAEAFPDVPPGTFYTEAVAWLEAEGLTTGVGDTGRFLPDRTVTRGEVATFLWRLSGRPAAPAAPFVDVAPGAYYAAAVGWLADEGLTTGVGGSNRYAPLAPVTRGELATLLWRLAGRPGGAHTFADVPSGAFYDDAVGWMAGTRITTGVGCTGLFQPDGSLTRGQLATFLHRYAGWAGIRPGGYTPPPDAVCDPVISVETLVDGRSIPWGLAFAPDGTMLFTERAGGITARRPDGTLRTLVARPADLWASGETGHMGIEVDPDFASNRRIYSCYGSTAPVGGTDVRVVAWTVDPGWTTATPAGPLVTGMPTSTGRHGGCQLQFAPDGSLLVGTGDAAIGTTPQDLTSLGGKVLRIDPATGQGAGGNPFITSANANTRRIFTYGHRNVQGLAVRASGQLWAVEHGPDRDDEVNHLFNGRNYGWNPVPGYDESVPMTFAGAQSAVWSSGSPTIATSGADFLRGGAWGTWDDALAVANLKGRHLRLFFLSDDGRFVRDLRVPELDGTYGRLRAARLGPDGALYVTTSNGGGADRVLRVAPG